MSFPFKSHPIKDDSNLRSMLVIFPEWYCPWYLDSKKNMSLISKWWNRYSIKVCNAYPQRLVKLIHSFFLCKNLFFKVGSLCNFDKEKANYPNILLCHSNQWCFPEWYCGSLWKRLISKDTHLLQLLIKAKKKNMYQSTEGKVIAFLKRVNQELCNYKLPNDPSSG